ncbi:MAG: glutamate-1-semialdehyde 2,1-aminomutase [Bdellovibrionaceae bacterium]|nr:glutamate-1-semialdehyde 2,1-aminomutase [Pseudobdellovibrionaceae bacterium]
MDLEIKVDFNLGKELQKRLRELVPAGSHTYSKGEDQFPLISPGLIRNAKGSYCWDVDGNKFLDFGMGLRSVGIGHADDEINEAIIKQLSLGTNFTRPSVLELEVAEKYVELIPSMEMVKFAKNGSDVTSAAVKLSRAYTGRKYIAICKSHPFFSVNDWFIGSTPCSNGVPREVQELTISFDYNDIESVKNLIENYPGKIAAFILEPLKDEEPKNNFLQELRSLSEKEGSVLIFDEMISGFRWNVKGAQEIIGIKPDLTTFGKATANGFSVSVLGGKKEIMELGGLDHQHERVFLLSQTHGAEGIGLAASLKNIEIYLRDKVCEHHWGFGKLFMDGINKLAEKYSIQDFFSIEGYACSPVIRAKNREKLLDLKFHTLFQQELIKKGVLMPWIAFCREHKEEELQITLDACDHALNIYSQAIEFGVDKFLIGDAIKPVWRKYN